MFLGPINTLIIMSFSNRKCNIPIKNNKLSMLRVQISKNMVYHLI